MPNNVVPIIMPFKYMLAVAICINGPQNKISPTASNAVNNAILFKIL